MVQLIDDSRLHQRLDIAEIGDKALVRPPFFGYRPALKHNFQPVGVAVNVSAFAFVAD
ncbi:hypothetical protein D3C71_1845600 [compost metagenome]